MMENMGYGQQEMLKDIVEKEAEEEEQPTATKEEEAKEQQQEPAAAKEQQYDNDDDHTRVEMVFNSPMTEFSEDSNINDLMKRMLEHIKIHVENSQMVESGFSLDEILGMTIKFETCQASRP